MGRYREYDDDDDSPEAVLACGRWQNNARRVLRSKRGRAALAEMREALLALPAKRLINGALCTVGAPEARFPVVTDEEIAADAERRAAFRAEWSTRPRSPEDAAWDARALREDREEEREAYRKVAEREGQGCCGIAAYLWHQKVRGGMDPDEAFAALPPVVEDFGDDPLRETAQLGEQAGLAFTLAWELAYRNDETYAAMTPEDRYAAFLAWIDEQLAVSAA